jgi:hypothetical protein
MSCTSASRSGKKSYGPDKPITPAIGGAGCPMRAKYRESSVTNAAMCAPAE